MGHGHSSSRTDGRGDGSRSRLRVSKDGTALGPALDPRSGAVCFLWFCCEEEHAV